MKKELSTTPGSFLCKTFYYDKKKFKTRADGGKEGASFMPHDPIFNAPIEYIYSENKKATVKRWSFE